MNALDPRPVDEDLAERPRRRQVLDPLRIELEDDLAVELAVGVGLEDSWSAASTSMTLRKRRMTRSSSRLSTFSSAASICATRRRGAAVVDVVRVEAGMEQLDQRAGDLGVAVQRLPHRSAG